MTAAGYRARRQARPVLLLMGVGGVCHVQSTLTAAFLSCVDRGRPTVACFMLYPHRLAAHHVCCPRTFTLRASRLSTRGTATRAHYTDRPACPASAGDP
jgi:hypothetical protein